MNYDHYLLTCWYIAIYIFTLLHVLKRGSFDVYGKDKGIVRNFQIVNFRSQNKHANPLYKVVIGKDRIRKEKPPPPYNIGVWGIYKGMFV